MKRYLVALFLFGLSVSGFAQTQCAAFPCVVATVSLTNQSQNIPKTPIFTPTTSGVFRINAYMSTSPGTVKRAVWGFYLGSTGDNGARQYATGSGPSSDNGYNATFVTQDVGGQPLFYQTKLTAGGNGNGGMTYNLYITVEQLQ
jgi:hypothetical protein